MIPLSGRNPLPIQRGRNGLGVGQRGTFQDEGDNGTTKGQVQRYPKRNGLGFLYRLSASLHFLIRFSIPLQVERLASVINAGTSRQHRMACISDHHACLWQMGEKIVPAFCSVPTSVRALVFLDLLLPPSLRIQ